ncbi:MAG: two-component system LytT family response regulator [Saprospiraceae bacterium]|jgi:two-component system LytT family response regulator
MGMNSSNIRSMIIDDDPFIRELLSDKLNQYFPEIEILSTAISGEDGLGKISMYKPDLIFLDVEMADMTGFEMLAQVENIDFKIIFITSYSHYAIKAIRFNALDYLLKPIDLVELKKAISRYKRSTLNNENLHLALQNLQTKQVSNHQLILKTQEGEINLVINDIIRLKGDSNYSYIYLRDGRKKLVSKTLAYLEELLAYKGFYRCHRSHLINGVHIEHNSKKDSVSLSDGSEVPIARRKKAEFNDWKAGYLN